MREEGNDVMESLSKAKRGKRRFVWHVEEDVERQMRGERKFQMQGMA